MTELDEAMMEHMQYIVFVERRPFSYKDFESFEVAGKIYAICHGTCRNKFSNLVRNGIIEHVYNSKITFYSLKGYRFTSKDKVTLNHMGIPSVTNVTSVIKDEMDDLLNYMKTIPVDQASVHDIHYKFTVPDIYKIMFTNPKYSRLMNKVSKDLILPSEIIDGLKIQTIIHRTDTVTVSVACSSMPITLDENGYMRCSLALTRVEERLSTKLDECGNNLEGGYEKIPIPDYRRWIITLWHFGKDGKFEYKNGFCFTGGYGRQLLRLYTKSLQGKKGLRNERQENPNKSHEDAFNEKLNEADDNPT